MWGRHDGIGVTGLIKILTDLMDDYIFVGI